MDDGAEGSTLPGGAGQGGASRVEEVLVAIRDCLGVDAEVHVSETDEGVDGEYVGEDVALLVGHHGATIDAIQHLAYRIAYRGGGARKQVSVDAAGYRERRAGSLRAIGDQAAEVAVRDRRPVVLDPMSPLERKVVHEHLKGRHDVETYSEGQEPSRRLVVAPVVD